MKTRIITGVGEFKRVNNFKYGYYNIIFSFDDAETLETIKQFDKNLSSIRCTNGRYELTAVSYAVTSVMHNKRDVIGLDDGMNGFLDITPILEGDDVTWELNAVEITDTDTHLMTKAEIMYNHFNVSYYTLRTCTTRREDHSVCTCYYVEWNCKHGDVSHFEQEITKEEYDYLVKEMENE